MFLPQLHVFKGLRSIVVTDDIVCGSRGNRKSSSRVANMFTTEQVWQAHTLRFFVNNVHDF